MPAAKISKTQYGIKLKPRLFESDPGGRDNNGSVRARQRSEGRKEGRRGPAEPSPLIRCFSLQKRGRGMGDGDGGFLLFGVCVCVCERNGRGADVLGNIRLDGVRWKFGEVIALHQ